MKVRYLIMVIMVLAILLVTGCDSNGNSGSTPKEGAGSAAILLRWCAGREGVEATATVDYAGRLVSATGEQGQDNFNFSETLTDEMTVDNVADFGQELFPDLKTGTWEVQAGNDGGWSAECTVDIHSGSTTSVYFTINRPGCERSVYTAPCE